MNVKNEHKGIERLLQKLLDAQKAKKKDNKIQNFIYFLLSFGSFNSNILRGRAKNYPPFHNLVFFLFWQPQNSNKISSR